MLHTISLRCIQNKLINCGLLFLSYPLLLFIHTTVCSSFFIPKGGNHYPSNNPLSFEIECTTTDQYISPYTSLSIYQDKLKNQHWIRKCRFNQSYRNLRPFNTYTHYCGSHPTNETIPDNSLGDIESFTHKQKGVEITENELTNDKLSNITSPLSKLLDNSTTVVKPTQTTPNTTKLGDGACITKPLIKIENETTPLAETDDIQKQDLQNFGLILMLKNLQSDPHTQLKTLQSLYQFVSYDPLLSEILIINRIIPLIIALIDKPLEKSMWGLFWGRENQKPLLDTVQITALQFLELLVKSCNKQIPHLNLLLSSLDRLISLEEDKLFQEHKGKKYEDRREVAIPSRSSKSRKDESGSQWDQLNKNKRHNDSRLTISTRHQLAYDLKHLLLKPKFKDSLDTSLKKKISTLEKIWPKQLFSFSQQKLSKPRIIWIPFYSPNPYPLITEATLAVPTLINNSTFRGTHILRVSAPTGGSWNLFAFLPVTEYDREHYVQARILSDALHQEIAKIDFSLTYFNLNGQDSLNFSNINLNQSQTQQLISQDPLIIDPYYDIRPIKKYSLDTLLKLINPEPNLACLETLLQLINSDNSLIDLLIELDGVKLLLSFLSSGNNLHNSIPSSHLSTLNILNEMVLFSNRVIKLLQGDRYLSSTLKKLLKRLPTLDYDLSLTGPQSRHIRAPHHAVATLRAVHKLMASLGLNNEWSPRIPGQRGIRILCLDGGGTRGVLTIAILKHFAAIFGRELHEIFDIICGTSTGGIIAHLLGAEKANIAELEYLYDALMADIFVKDAAAVTSARLVVRKAYYDESLLETILHKAFNSSRMIDSACDPTTPKIFFISSILSSSPSQLILWRNYNTLANENRHASSFQVYVKDALRATTAAPGFFPAVKLNGQTYGDGAVLANNPTAIALSEAKSLFPNTPIEVVVSLGTGRFIGANSEKSVGWDGILQQLISSATNTESTHELLSDLLPPHIYFRFNPLVEESPIDETRPDRITIMKRFIERYFEDDLENKARLLQLQKQILGENQDSKLLYWSGQAENKSTYLYSLFLPWRKQKNSLYTDLLGIRKLWKKRPLFENNDNVYKKFDDGRKSYDKTVVSARIPIKVDTESNSPQEQNNTQYKDLIVNSNTEAFQISDKVDFSRRKRSLWEWMRSRKAQLGRQATMLIATLDKWATTDRNETSSLSPPSGAREILQDIHHTLSKRSRWLLSH